MNHAKNKAHTNASNYFGKSRFVHARLHAFIN